MSIASGAPPISIPGTASHPISPLLPSSLPSSPTGRCLNARQYPATSAGHQQINYIYINLMYTKSEYIRQRAAQAVPHTRSRRPRPSATARQAADCLSATSPAPCAAVCASSRRRARCRRPASLPPTCPQPRPTPRRPPSAAPPVRLVRWPMGSLFPTSSTRSLEALGSAWASLGRPGLVSPTERHPAPPPGGGLRRASRRRGAACISPTARPLRGEPSLAASGTAAD